MRTPAVFGFMLLLLGGRATAQEKLDLNFRFAKGDVHHVTATLTQSIEQVLRDAKQTTDQTITLRYVLGVDEVDLRGWATVSIRYEGVAFKARTPGGAVDYDSSNPPGQVPAELTALAALVGQGYSARVDPQGLVQEVMGLPKLQKAVLGQLNLPQGPARTAAENVLGEQLKESNLKANLQNLFAPLPDHGVALGESWKRTTRVTLGFAMSVESTYTLQSRDGGVATIGVTGKAATSPDAVIDLKPLKMNYTLAGEQTGLLRVDESTGWTKTSELSQRLTGSVTVRGPNTDPQTVPTTITSQVRMESK